MYGLQNSLPHSWWRSAAVTCAWSHTSSQWSWIVAPTWSMICSACAGVSRNSPATSRHSHSWLARRPSRVIPMAWLEVRVDRGWGARSYAGVSSRFLPSQNAARLRR